jgi:uncharacterized protein
MSAYLVEPHGTHSVSITDMRRILLVCLFTSAVAAQTASDAFTRKLVAAANDRPNHPVRYDPGYVKIPYPHGDVPADTGVCSDEIIRIYRAVGIDLQKEVHEDMLANSSEYPYREKWKQATLDTNIDHRRVPNLMVFFSRKGQSLSLTDKRNEFLPGDIITWMLPSGRDHIGMVTDQKTWFGRYKVEHNIGDGPKVEDVLFTWKITGHYRYGPAQPKSRSGGTPGATLFRLCLTIVHARGCGCW